MTKAPAADSDEQLAADRRRSRLVAAAISMCRDMPPEALFRATRGTGEESTARQVFNLVWLRMGDEGGSAAAVARLARAVGRDRSTVQHAVKKIEALCEQSPGLDRMISELAEIARRASRIQPVILAAIQAEEGDAS